MGEGDSEGEGVRGSVTRTLKSFRVCSAAAREASVSLSTSSSRAISLKSLLKSVSSLSSSSYKRVVRCEV